MENCLVFSVGIMHQISFEVFSFHRQSNPRTFHHYDAVWHWLLAGTKVCPYTWHPSDEYDRFWSVRWHVCWMACLGISSVYPAVMVHRFHFAFGHHPPCIAAGPIPVQLCVHHNGSNNLSIHRCEKCPYTHAMRSNAVPPVVHMTMYWRHVCSLSGDMDILLCPLQLRLQSNPLFSPHYYFGCLSYRKYRRNAIRAGATIYKYFPASMRPFCGQFSSWVRWSGIALVSDAKQV